VDAVWKTFPPSSNSKWPGISTRQTAGAGDYLVYLGGWTRYGSRPRPEGTPSSVDRSNTLRSVAPSDKGSPTSTSGPPVALRSARIYRGRLLDQQVIPTLGYSAPATRPPHGALGSEGGRPRATRRVRSSDGRGLGGGDSGAPPSADATFCRRKDFQPRTDPLRGRKGLALGPDVAVTPRGEFIAAWQERGSSSVKTVVRTLRVATP